MKKILLLLIFILAADISYAAEKKQPAQPDFRNETIYFLMTDRFADGDPSNNNIYGDDYGFNFTCRS